MQKIFSTRLEEATIDEMNRVTRRLGISKRQFLGTDLWIGALQRAEVVFFMRPKEVGPTRMFMARFKTEAVTQIIVDAAGELYRRWHPSHGIQINDAMLAATVASTGGKIYTLNLTHYPMPDVTVVKGW